MNHDLSPKRSRDAWFANMRERLNAPLHGIIALVELMIVRAERAAQGIPPEFLPALREILVAAQSAHTLTIEVFELAESGQLEDHSERNHSHELRSALTPVVNIADLWIERARKKLYLEGFIDDLRAMQKLGHQMVKGIDDVRHMAEVACNLLPHAAVGSLPPPLTTSTDFTGGPTGRLLLVDDNRHQRHVLSDGLRDRGHTVIGAKDGREALAKIRTERYDVILLDLLMPELSGWDVLTRMKADKRLRHLPVIIISALDEFDSYIRCIEVGAEDYFPKPCKPSLLHARVGACLEKKRIRDREVLYHRKIRREEKRAQDMLRAAFPDRVLAGLKDARLQVPSSYPRVAVVFANLVGFTTYCENKDPDQILQYVDKLIVKWERSAFHHQVQKIKTIGGAFMAAAGLLDDGVKNPVLNCIKCGLDLIAAAEKLPEHWDVRVGIDFGPVGTGVVGSSQRLFDLWGDTVKTAARIESLGEPGRIMLSMRAWEQVSTLCRGRTNDILIKGNAEERIPCMQFAGFSG